MKSSELQVCVKIDTIVFLKYIHTAIPLLTAWFCMSEITHHTTCLNLHPQYHPEGMTLGNSEQVKFTNFLLHLNPTLSMGFTKNISKVISYVFL